MPNIRGLKEWEGKFKGEMEIWASFVGADSSKGLIIQKKDEKKEKVARNKGVYNSN